MVVFETTSMI